MLKQIKFSNFRSYYDEQIFSMVASKEKKYLENNTFGLAKSLFNGRLLKNNIIIGLNASGKSNLLATLNYCKYIINNSNKVKGNIFKDTDESFLMSESAKDEPKCFEIEFFYDNEYFYKYSFCILNAKVKSESLYLRTATNSNRLSPIKCLFEREGNEIIYSNDEFSKIKELLELKSSVLFLSFCNTDLKEEICPNGKRVLKWFDELYFINNQMASLNIYEENIEYLDKVVKILQKTDKSLKKLSIEKRKIDIPIENMEEPSSIFKALKKSNIQVDSGFLTVTDDGLYNIDIVANFDLYKNKKLNSLSNETIKFSVFDSDSKISLGQSKLIRCFAFILKVLDKGGILFVDELDGQLHHQFPKIIMEAFNDKELNKNNAQLIFTTHSSSLLDRNVRRDQVNLISKDEKGISRISPLERVEGKRVKSTNSLSNLWSTNQINSGGDITIEDLHEILI